MSKPVESKYKDEMTEIEDKKTNKQKRKRFILLLLSIILLSGFISAGGIGIWYGTKDIINHNHKPHPTDPSQPNIPEIPADIENELIIAMKQVKWDYDNGLSTPTSIDVKIWDDWNTYGDLVFKSLSSFVFSINNINDIDSVKKSVYDNFISLTKVIFDKIKTTDDPNDLWFKVTQFFFSANQFDVPYNNQPIYDSVKNSITSFEIDKVKKQITFNINYLCRLFAYNEIGGAYRIKGTYLINYKEVK